MDRNCWLGKETEGLGNMQRPSKSGYEVGAEKGRGEKHVES
jgi:hypothetical protein